MAREIVNRTLLGEIVKETTQRALSNGGGDDAINEAVSYVLSQRLRMLNEMAFKRKEYKEKVSNLSAQIIENWCLVRHAVVSGDRDNLGHWGEELFTHLMACARLRLKGDDSFEKRLYTLDEVWRDYDYYDEDTIDFVIQAKFLKEGISIMGKEYAQILMDCVQGAHKILEVIASHDSGEIKDYVQTLKTK